MTGICDPDNIPYSFDLRYVAVSEKIDLWTPSYIQKVSISTR